MRILEGKEKQEAIKFLEEAARVAAGSLCLRAQCGSVIVKDEKVIGRGHNSPPQDNPDFRTCSCEYDIPTGFRHDRTCCIHAEQRAIIDAVKNRNDARGSQIFFTRIDENKNRVPSHRLCCTICSRAVLDAGISEFILEWEDGTTRAWSADEFDRLSYEYKTPIKRDE